MVHTLILWKLNSTKDPGRKNKVDAYVLLLGKLCEKSVEVEENETPPMFTK